MLVKQMASEEHSRAKKRNELERVSSALVCVRFLARPNKCVRLGAFPGCLQYLKSPSCVESTPSRWPGSCDALFGPGVSASAQPCPAGTVRKVPPLALLS